jgi:hypothetical protein
VGILALQHGEDVNAYPDGFEAEFTDKPTLKAPKALRVG